jgi:hypothetical protein
MLVLLRTRLAIAAMLALAAGPPAVAGDFRSGPVGV